MGQDCCSGLAVRGLAPRSPPASAVLPQAPPGCVLPALQPSALQPHQEQWWRGACSVPTGGWAVGSTGAGIAAVPVSAGLWRLLVMLLSTWLPWLWRLPAMLLCSCQPGCVADLRGGPLPLVVFFVYITVLFCLVIKGQLTYQLQMPNAATCSWSVLGLGNACYLPPRGASRGENLGLT